MQLQPEHENCFRALHIGNPYRDWDKTGQALLAGLLESFLEVESLKKAPLEGEATKIRRFLVKMREVQAAYREISGSPLMQTCNPEHRTYAHMRDVEIAITESPSNGLARAGQDVRLYANVRLAMACELVRVREVRVDFGALEELLGQIKPDAQAIHAESLRERVKYLEKHHPEIYAAVPLMLSEQAPEAPEKPIEEAQIDSWSKHGTSFSPRQTGIGPRAACTLARQGGGQIDERLRARLA